MQTGITAQHHETDGGDDITSGQSGYWAVDVRAAQVVGIQVSWPDAVTAGAIRIYSTLREDAPIPAAASEPDLEYWSEDTSELTITDPAGAKGSCVIHTGIVGARKFLVRFAATAASKIEVRSLVKG